MNNVLVVFKKSAYEIYKDSPDSKVSEFVSQDNEMIESHDRQNKTLESVMRNLERLGIDYDMIYRADLEEVKDRDLVVSVGGDGTVLEVSHYVKDIPILGVNSDPDTSVGFFCCSNMYNFEKMLDAKKTGLNRLQASINGKKIPELVLNDILIAHSNPAATTRYKIEGDEDYKNSGLLVCTAAGSTAWMYEEGGFIMELKSKTMQYLTRGERGARPRYAYNLTVESLTRQGKIYIDGEHLTYDFTMGDILKINKGKPLYIVGDLESKRKKF